MVRCVAFQLSPPSLRDLTAALQGTAILRLAADERQLSRLVSHRRHTVIVLDLTGPAAKLRAVAAKALTRSFPGVPMVAYCRLGPESSEIILEFCRAGGDGLILQGYDDAALVLRRTVATSDAGHRAVNVMGRLSGGLPLLLEPVVREALKQLGPELSVSRLAAGLGKCRRSLTDLMARHNLPSPGVVIAWVRIIAAAQLLDDMPGRRIADVARAVGIGSEATFRAVIRRHLGLTPQDIRHLGTACIMERFLAVLQDGEHQLTGSRSA